MIRFSANLSMLFLEVPELERPAAARRAGFDAVEVQFPYGHEAGQWREAAQMHERLGRLGDALRCGEAFLRLVPEGEAAERMRAGLADIRGRLN